MDLQLIISRASEAKELRKTQFRIYQTIGRCDLEKEASDALYKEVADMEREIEKLERSIKRLCE